MAPAGHSQDHTSPKPADTLTVVAGAGEACQLTATTLDWRTKAKHGTQEHSKPTARWGGAQGGSKK